MNAKLAVLAAPVVLVAVAVSAQQSSDDIADKIVSNRSPTAFHVYGAPIPPRW